MNRSVALGACVLALLLTGEGCKRGDPAAGSASKTGPATPTGSASAKGTASGPINPFSFPTGLGGVTKSKMPMPLALDEELLKQANDARAAAKLPPLVLNPKLATAAKLHAEGMAKQKKLEQVVNGKNPIDQAHGQGYMPTSIEVLMGAGNGTLNKEMFNLDPSLKKALVKGEYQDLGVGYAHDSAENKIYYTVLLGSEQKNQE